MGWNVVSRTLRASNALRTGNQNYPPENEGLARGFQRRRTDRPLPADARPAPPNPYFAPLPRPPHDEATPHRYAPPRQQSQPQQDFQSYSHPQGTHVPSQDYDHRYNTHQDYVPRHNRDNPFPFSQGGTYNGNMGPDSESAYQEPDRQLQYPRRQDSNLPYHQNPDQYGPSSASHLGSNQGYAGQPHQEQYPHTNTNPGAYEQDQSGYRSTSYGQGQGYPHYPQSSYSNAQSFGRGTTAPADYPHSHGVPPNSDYNDGDKYNERSHR